MKVRPLLADTGRPADAFAVNLLNAGWAVTNAKPVDEGGYALDAQVIAVFIEAPWDRLNRPLRLSLELVDDGGRVAQLKTRSGLVAARTEYEVTIPQTPGAPNGTPGSTCTMFEMASGFVRVPAMRRRYVWKVAVDGVTEEVGFWVRGERPQPLVG